VSLGLGSKGGKGDKYGGADVSSRLGGRGGEHGEADLSLGLGGKGGRITMADEGSKSPAAAPEPEIRLPPTELFAKCVTSPTAPRV
jgi:hypothetical protein